LPDTRLEASQGINTLLSLAFLTLEGTHANIGMALASVTS